jgi:ethanolamine ammonia-lyase large subunit
MKEYIGGGARRSTDNRPTEKSVTTKARLRYFLDETGVEFDEDKIDRIVSDVHDEAHLNARRATRGKYE